MTNAVPSAPTGVIHLVNYSDATYRAARLHQNHRARDLGIHSIASWTRADVEKTPFYQMYRSILDQQRGSGYWLWKPFILYHALLQASDGDAVIYADAGIDFLTSPAPLIDAAAQNGGFFLTWQRNRNRAYTKRDCFVLLGCDEPLYYDAHQCDASFQLYLRSAATLSFARQYLHACADAAVLTDGEAICGLPELDGFHDHRHDQSVLTLLCLAHGVRRYPQVSQYQTGEDQADPGDFSTSIPGGPFLYHHRSKGDTSAAELPDTQAIRSPPLPATFPIAVTPARRITVSVQTNWCTEDVLLRHLNCCTPQGDLRWKDIELVPGTAADLHVIFNHHRHQNYDPRRTIVFECETRATRARIRDGGYVYAPNDYLHVHDTERYHTVDKWYVNLPYAFLKDHRNFEKSHVMSGIVSALNHLPGHRERLAFLTWLDRLPFYDHFGRGDLAHLRTFRGELPRKADGLIPYRYHFNAENSVEKNYFTEKIIDPLLCESLCFYAGCPNLHEHLPFDAFVPISLNDPACTLQTIVEHIEQNNWVRRLPAIREAKRHIMDTLNPLEMIWRIATGRQLPSQRSLTPERVPS